MPFFAGEDGREKRVGNLGRERRADHSRAETQHVHVVMFDRLVRGVGVVANGGAYTRKLARRNRHARAAAADDDPSLGLPVAQGGGDGFG